MDSAILKDWGTLTTDYIDIIMLANAWGRNKKWASALEGALLIKFWFLMIR